MMGREGSLLTLNRNRLLFLFFFFFFFYFFFFLLLSLLFFVCVKKTSFRNVLIIFRNLSLKFNPFTAMISFENDPAIKTRNLKPLRLFVIFFALACEWIFIKSHSTENRCYRTEKYTVCRRVRASISLDILQAAAVKGLIDEIYPAIERTGEHPEKRDSVQATRVSKQRAT